MSLPSFTNQFPVAVLPRVGDVDLNERVAFPPLTALASSSDDLTVVDFAVSKSMIASYLIKPSPKLLWSYALRPSAIVESIDVLDQNADGKKYYLVGITERRNYQILLVEADVGTTADGNVNITTSKEYTLTKTDDRILLVKFLSLQKILVSYASGTVEIISFDSEKVEDALQSSTKIESKRREHVIYSTMVTDLEGTLLLTVSKPTSSKTTLIYKLISITFDTTQSLAEVQNIQKEFKLDSCSFAYNAGILYQYHDARIEAISIVNFTNTKHTLALDSIIEPNFAVSLRAPAPDRVLLANGDKLYLINVKYGALLSEYKSVSSSSNPVADIVSICQVISVKGQSQNTLNTTAFYLNLKNKDKNLYLNVVDVNVGQNKLSECLGKALTFASGKSLQNPKDLYDENSLKTTSHTDANGHSKSELDEVYDSLKEAQEQKDIEQWESILIPYLKNKKSWKEIKQKQKQKQQSLKSRKKDQVYQFKEFEVEHDRIVNIEFVQSLFELIFVTSPSLQFKDADFIPEYTLMYLLTSPIFPSSYAQGLIPLFEQVNNKTLMRQAIITCSNIPLQDLVQQFVKESDLDVFTDLIDRIVVNYSISEITTVFNEVVKSYDGAIDIIGLVNKLLAVKTYNNWNLIEILININGLFNWTDENIERMESLVDSKIEVLDINAYNVTLVDQVALKKNQIANSSKKQKQKEKQILDVEAMGLLKITDQTNLGGKKVESVVDAKIPLYSVEVLEV